jgi:hypothetical protein
VLTGRLECKSPSSESALFRAAKRRADKDAAGKKTSNEFLRYYSAMPVAAAVQEDSPAIIMIT